MPKSASLFGVISQAVDERDDLQTLSPRVRRRMKRSSSRALAKWWPADHTPEYVEAHQAEVEKNASQALNDELVVGFVGVVPLLVSALLSAVANYIVRRILAWMLETKTTAMQAILEAKVAAESADEDSNTKD